MCQSNIIAWAGDVGAFFFVPTAYTIYPIVSFRIIQ